MPPPTNHMTNQIPNRENTTSAPTVPKQPATSHARWMGSQPPSLHPPTLAPTSQQIKKSFSPTFKTLEAAQSWLERVERWTQNFRRELRADLMGSDHRARASSTPAARPRAARAAPPLARDRYNYKGTYNTIYRYAWSEHTVESINISYEQ